MLERSGLKAFILQGVTNLKSLQKHWINRTRVVLKNIYNNQNRKSFKMDEHPRQMNLQGLLRFAMEYTKSEDAKNTSTFEKMDDERKKFLQAALKSMTVDVIEEFEKAIKALENPTATLNEKKDAFELIREYIDNIDFANNFIKVGGATTLIAHLSHENNHLKANALNVIAEMAQNNPFCQKYFIEAQIMPMIIEYFKSTDPDVANSALYTASSLVRSYEPALANFIEKGGIEALLECLNTPHSRVFVKSCFLIANLSTEFAVVRDEFVIKLAPNQITNQLEAVMGFDIKLETLLFALSELTKSKQWNPGPSVDNRILKVLQEIINQNSNLPECEDTVRYANEVIENINTLD